jgi:hypothetical protein
MTSEVIVGLITAASAVICQVLISYTGRKAGQAERAENQRLIVYRFEQLESKVTLHNNVIDRVYKLENQTEVMREKMNVANHRIDDLEHNQH